MLIAHSYAIGSFECEIGQYHTIVFSKCFLFLINLIQREKDMPDYLIGFNIVRYTRKTKHDFSTHSLSCKYNELILIMYYHFRPVFITALMYNLCQT